jgi:hypothetical protein
MGDDCDGGAEPASLVRCSLAAGAGVDDHEVELIHVGSKQMHTAQASAAQYVLAVRSLTTQIRGR